MKNIFTLFVILSSSFLFSQNRQVVFKSEDSKTLKGTIDGNPITMYLENGEMVDCAIYDTYVKGWYYYDKYKIKIPLSGYSKQCDLKLFNLGPNHTRIAKKQIEENSIYVIDSLYEKVKDVEFMKFDRCIYTEEKPKNWKGTFTKNDKSSNIIITNTDLTIHSEYEFYTLPNNKKIDLLKVLKSYPGNKFFSQKEDKNENRIIFTFNTISNQNCNGMCGASEGEKGYRIIYFDKKWNIKKTEEFLTDSCLQSIYDTKIVKKNKESIKYKILDANGNFSHFFTVNPQNSTILKTNK
jgi:hypothetical protein